MFCDDIMTSFDKYIKTHSVTEHGECGGKTRTGLKLSNSESQSHMSIVYPYRA